MLNKTVFRIFIPPSLKKKLLLLDSSINANYGLKNPAINLMDT